MTSPAVTVSLETTVSEVAKTLLKEGIRAVAVVDGAGNVMGLVSETDLLVRNARLHFPSYLGILETVLPIGGDRNLDDELRRVLATTAKEVMTDHVHTAGPDDDLGEVAHYMVQHHLHAVPVVKDGKLQGVLYASDLVKLVAQETA